MDRSSRIAPALLLWYDKNKRTLPFRGTRDPYRIWLSEIMLQQTRTETVGPYYERFLAQFPDIFALAGAQETDVLKAWEGLGYYSRARNLLKCARVVCEQYGGEFPRTKDELTKLPGIGDYTAGAIASIAFDMPCPAMDGNLTRVYSRLFSVHDNVMIPSVRRALYETAQKCMPKKRSGEFNQALMDLGASICVPGTPDCSRCPLVSLCGAYKDGDAETLPNLPQKTPPKVIDYQVILLRFGEKLYMTRRKEALLNGLYVFLMSEDSVEDTLSAMHLKYKKPIFLGSARHVFTHKIWQMDICEAEIAEIPSSMADDFYTWEQMTALPVPTAMKAAMEHAKKLLHGA